MNKTKIILQMFIVLGCAFLASCTHFGAQTSAKKGEVEHIVFIWLKESGNAKQRAEVIASMKTLKEIPGVTSLSAGEVLASDRPIVDDSYDVAMIVRFASKDVGAVYQPHPLHVKAQQVMKPLTKKVLIYDYTVK